MRTLGKGSLSLCQAQIADRNTCTAMTLWSSLQVDPKPDPGIAGLSVPEWSLAGKRDIAGFLQEMVEHAARHLPVAAVILQWRGPRWNGLATWYVAPAGQVESHLREIARTLAAVPPHAPPRVYPLSGTQPFLLALPVVWRGQHLATLAALLPTPDVPPGVTPSLHFYSRIIVHLFAQVQLALDLYALLEATRHLVESHEMAAVLERLLEYATALTDTEAGSVLLYDDKTDNLSVAAAIGPVAPAVKTLNVPLQSIAGKAFRGNAPVVVQDTAKVAEHWEEADRATGFVTRSLVAVPIPAKGKPIGVLEVLNKRSGPFNDHDLDLLQGLAYYAGAVIHQAQLIAQDRNTLRQLRRVSEQRAEFLRVLSHELRTPLTVIRGYAEILADEIGQLQQKSQETPDPQLLLPLIQEILQGVQRLTAVIEQIARASTVLNVDHHIEMSPVSVGELVRQAWQTLQPYARRKHLHVTFTIPDTLPSVMGDAIALREAIYQLLDNAIKFTPENGRVDVRVEVGKEWVAVHVSDAGPGIPPEEQEAIFLPFYQGEDPLTRKHGGLGLGLSIAKQVVESHKGQILVHSTPGVGSTFTILLPRHRTLA